MLGYVLLKSKEDVYSKTNRYNKRHLLYKKDEYYVGVIDGRDVKVYDELDNASLYHWFGCFHSNPDCRYHFEVIKQAAAFNKKEFYKIRMDLRNPAIKSDKEHKKEPTFNEMLPDAIRKIVIGELLQKAIKGTTYESFYNKHQCLPVSRYIDDKLIKFLMQEFENIATKYN